MAAEGRLLIIASYIRDRAKADFSMRWRYCSWRYQHLKNYILSSTTLHFEKSHQANNR